MIMTTDLCHVFPEYTGGKNLLPALEFIKNKFLNAMPQSKRTLQDGVHFVSGVVKRDVREAFGQVEKVLLQFNESTIAEGVKKIRYERNQIGKKSGLGCGR